MPAKWQEMFKVKENLVQRDVYAFEDALRKAGGIMLQTASITAAHMVRAAIEAKWIESPETKHGEIDGKKVWFIGSGDIDDMNAGRVRWYGQQVSAAYNQAVELPPN